MPLQARRPSRKVVVEIGGHKVVVIDKLYGSASFAKIKIEPTCRATNGRSTEVGYLPIFGNTSNTDTGTSQRRCATLVLVERVYSVDRRRYAGPAIE